MAKNVALVICYVVENVSEEQARSSAKGAQLDAGWLKSTVEDRTADGEGWACVSYFTVESGHYGRRVLADIDGFGAAARSVLRPEPREEAQEGSAAYRMNYGRRRFAEYLERRRRQPAPVIG